MVECEILTRQLARVKVDAAHGPVSAARAGPWQERPREQLPCLSR